jgi:hypothetical protein
LAFIVGTLVDDKRDRRHFAAYATRGHDLESPQTVNFTVQVARDRDVFRFDRRRNVRALCDEQRALTLDGPFDLTLDPEIATGAKGAIEIRVPVDDTKRVVVETRVIALAGNRGHTLSIFSSVCIRDRHRNPSSLARSARVLVNVAGVNRPID